MGLLLAVAPTAALDASEKWGPFRGQLVDAETGEPLEGAVILVVWWADVYTPVQTNTKFYDAREAVTDAQGRFEVPRRRPAFFSFRIRPPDIIPFAPGYEVHSRIVSPSEGRPFVTPTVVKMRHLDAREDRIKAQRRYPPSVPARKMPRLLDLLNKERAALGLEPITRGVPDDPK